MEKVYLIGDCQSLPLYEYFTPNNNYIDFKVWALKEPAASAYFFSPEKLKKDNVISHKQDGISFAEITDDGLIVSWLGYQDIMFFLPKYDNAEIVVKQYVDRLIEAFPNSNIIIAEPHPQFKDFLKLNATEYSYEERVSQNDKFCEALKKYCSDLKIEIITQKQMLDFIGVKELNISHSKVVDGVNVDILESQYMVKLYNLFMKRIYDKLMRERMDNK